MGRLFSREKPYPTRSMDDSSAVKVKPPMKFWKVFLFS